ncbi:unnamed protein product [Protopolystoma xenopodis]|uniref:Uncharacterized protein n=1 Tax=Protopolystoma xenopodis TaxID=117903 RepID=A0A3S5FD63_9PLAT|nr:unnamed protein product [Protopolystoma xenopodis]
MYFSHRLPDNRATSSDESNIPIASTRNQIYLNIRGSSKPGFSTFLWIGLFVRLSVFQSVDLFVADFSVCRSVVWLLSQIVNFAVSLSSCPSIGVSVCLSVGLSVCASIRLSVSLSVGCRFVGLLLSRLLQAM